MKLNILTDEQKTVLADKVLLEGLYKGNAVDRAVDLACEAQAKLTLRQYIGWMSEPCPHTGGLEEQQMYKPDCPKCWKELKQLSGETK